MFKRYSVSQDEKDRRIRELTIELNNEKQRCKRRCAAYQEQLRKVLSYVEEHTIHLSNKVGIARSCHEDGGFMLFKVKYRLETFSVGFLQDVTRFSRLKIF